MRTWWIIAGVAAIAATLASQRQVRETVSEAIDTAADALRDLIARFEGYSPTVYQDAAGHWTIGYGHLVKAGEPYYPYGAVTEISREEAAALLAADMAEAAWCVDTQVIVPLTENQRAALVSFVYNVGCAAFRGSALLRRLNAGDYDAAANEFERWTRAGGRVLPGLVARRKDEAELFRTA